MNYAQLITDQRLFFNSNQSLNVDFRIEQLKKLLAAVRKNEKNLYDAIYTDFKKSEFDTYASELSFIYHEIKTAMAHVQHWSASKPVPTNLINFPASSYVVPQPLGVCLVIGAWNYPYMLSLLPLIAAMTAGNTVILKPSEIPLATSHAMANMIKDTFAPDYITVVEGGIIETTQLLEEKFDKIFFTGSTAVGKIIYQAAAKHLTPVTLELGGKSPVIVTKEANLNAAAKRISWSKFLNAGQTCIAPDYVLVDASVKEKFLHLLKENISRNKYGMANNNYVQIINDRNYNRLIKLMDRSKIHFGGEAIATDRYIGPTLLTDISFDDEIMQEEIFGPVLPIIEYHDPDDLFQALKLKPKPLACYIFTNDEKIKDKFRNELQFGGGAINDIVMQISNPNLPFGGVGESGTGYYHGKNGFDAFSHQKAIIDKPLWLETPLKYPPYSRWKLTILKWIMGR